MAFRASSAIPAAALDEAKRTALRVKQVAQAYSTKFLAATTRRDDVIGCWQEFSAFAAALVRLRDTPGIGAYATAQENDGAYDVTAEFNALLTAVNDVVNNIASTFPKDASSFLAVAKFGAGSLDYGTFTAAQLLTLRTLLDAAAAQVA
jgi:hypothetical protein